MLYLCREQKPIIMNPFSKRAEDKINRLFTVAIVLFIVWLILGIYVNLN